MQRDSQLVFLARLVADNIFPHTNRLRHVVDLQSIFQESAEDGNWLPCHYPKEARSLDIQSLGLPAKTKDGIQIDYKELPCCWGQLCSTLSLLSEQ